MKEIHFVFPANADRGKPSWLEALGHTLVRPQALLEYHGLNASDAQRARQIEEVLSVKGRFVMAGRGGYGSFRALQKLKIDPDWEGVFCGFSDLTALLNTLPLCSRLLCLHGPHLSYPAEILPDGHLISNWRRLMSGHRNWSGHFAGSIHGAEKLQGPIFGGNLSVFASLIGTEYEPSFKDRILFLEDLNEPTYQLDRLLRQIKAQRGFSELKGLVLGQFTHCLPQQEDGYNAGLNQVLDEFVSELNCTVVRNAPIGHIQDFMLIPMFGQALFQKTSAGIEYHLGFA